MEVGHKFETSVCYSGPFNMLKKRACDGESDSSRSKKCRTDCGAESKGVIGIGMKLMEKMGYKGGGLGKHEQGMLQPIEAIIRPKNLGLGFNQDIRTELLESDEKPFPSPSHSLEGHKPSSLRKKKMKVYTTLLGQKQEQAVIIDMRGPHVRVLTSFEKLNAQGDDIPFPELQHNITLIVDLTELDIQKLDYDMRSEREKVAALKEEKEKLQKEAHEQRQQLLTMEEIARVLDQIGEKSSSGALTLDSLAKSFLVLETRFGDYYTLCNLSCIFCSYALPLFIEMFQGWDPLQDPTHGVEVVFLWMKLLQGSLSSYTQLLMEVVFPALTKSATNSWRARDPEPMLRFLESWKDLLPTPLLQTILDTIVMPKISAAVDTCDPCKETIPMHSWIHPWLPMLGNRLEALCQIISDRLASALRAWHPSDAYAYYILSPWKPVFDSASWEQLMVRCIVPKLFAVMDELKINPANQDLEQLYWVRTWLTAIPTHHMLRLMNVFFNKWQQVLYHWLSAKPNFEEVAKWFLGWKELLPAELQANEHIRYRLNLGLDIMNQAVEGMEMAPPRLKENISYLRACEHRQFESQEKAAQCEDTNDEMSLKEVIEIYAQQNGLVFMPKPGRTQDGHQIYGFGGISIIIDSLNQKVFAQIRGSWYLVSLQQLLHRGIQVEDFLK